MGSDEDRFTKAEIQAGHTKLHPVPGQNQHLVTGAGGPSGTGKRPAGTPVLPAPVFLADLPPGQTNSNSGSSSGGSGSGSSTASKDANGKKPTTGGASGANNGATAPSAWPIAGNMVVASALDKEEEKKGRSRRRAKGGVHPPLWDLSETTTGRSWMRQQRPS